MSGAGVLLLLALIAGSMFLRSLPGSSDNDFDHYLIVHQRGGVSYLFFGLILDLGLAAMRAAGLSMLAVRIILLTATLLSLGGIVFLFWLISRSEEAFKTSRPPRLRRGGIR